MKSIKLFFKGFIMGIANIIPGVSGGTLAIILGIYERLLEAISHFFKNFKENIKFLIPVFLGIGVSLITMSNLIDYSYKHFPLPTTVFFVGLVLGGIPLLINKTKKEKNKNMAANIIAFMFTFSLVLVMAFADKIFGMSKEVVLTNMGLLGYIKLLLVGCLSSATMIIPGVSGSLVLMLIGYYYPVISTIKELTHFNNIIGNGIVLAVFGIGIVVGLVLVAKLLEYLFKRHAKATYCGVLGFIFASLIAIPASSYGVIINGISLIHIIISFITLIIGCFVAYKLGEK
jgi:putative membrane protein